MSTVVVGGGIAGLAAAALLARAGRKVTVFERSRLGGRAQTTELAGACFDLGPHALYRAGRAMEVLRALGIEPRGAVPKASGALAWWGGRLHAFPAGPASLLTTSLLTLPEKLELGRLLASSATVDTASLAAMTVSQWLEGAARHPRVREVAHAFVRLATYANHPDSLSAQEAVLQLRRLIRSRVLYVDGGWQSLVEALRGVAQGAGARIIEGHKVESLSELNAREIVLAVPPAEAVRLTGSAQLKRWAGTLTPIRAAVLDLALRELPRPRSTFALGIDRPVYYSVHSGAAKLGPSGIHVVQTARYLGPNDAGMNALSQLEELMDAVQPTWRKLVAERRFLPEMTVAHAVPTLSGRPGVDAAGIPGVYLAGDWVGAEGMLADAALASAAEAAQRILKGACRAAA